jgi:hypothetical protein
LQAKRLEGDFHFAFYKTKVYLSVDEQRFKQKVNTSTAAKWKGYEVFGSLKSKGGLFNFVCELVIATRKALSSTSNICSGQ